MTRQTVLMVATEEYLCPVVPLMAEELFERRRHQFLDEEVVPDKDIV